MPRILPHRRYVWEHARSLGHLLCHVPLCPFSGPPMKAESETLPLGSHGLRGGPSLTVSVCSVTPRSPLRPPPGAGSPEAGGGGGLLACFFYSLHLFVNSCLVLEAHSSAQTFQEAENPERGPGRKPGDRAEAQTAADLPFSRRSLP